MSNPPVADYNLHREKVQFSLGCSQAETRITFCGGGKSDSYGVVIDNVKLTYLDCRY